MTAAIRCSAVRFARPWASVLAVPGTSGVSQAERQTLAYMYSGILAGEDIVVPPDEPAVRQGGAYLKKWWRVGDRNVYGNKKAVAQLLRQLAQEHAEEDVKEAKKAPRKVTRIAEGIPVLQEAPVQVIEQMADRKMAQEIERLYINAYEQAFKALMRKRAEEEQDDEEALLLLL